MFFSIGSADFQYRTTFLCPQSLFNLVDIEYNPVQICCTLYVHLVELKLSQLRWSLDGLGWLD